MIKNPKIVVIGGGTGSFTLLSKLKNYSNNITAVVNMADDGGSTGILRDELGVLPPGDVRQCLVALAEDQSDLRELFNYRFGEGSLGGHSFGNLFLSALEKTSEDFAQAVEKASKILKITGTVLPITLSDSHLVLKTSDGIELEGEQAIAQMQWERGFIPQLSLKPKSVLFAKAKSAILEADLVVIAPGHLYGSLAPALLVNEVGEVLSQTKAVKAYVCNLVTKPGQTDGFTCANFASEIERFANAEFLDYVLYNTKKPSASLLKRYAKEGELPVEEGKTDKTHKNKPIYIAADLISDEIYSQNPNDKLLQRTLIRHDADKVAKELLKLVVTP